MLPRKRFQKDDFNIITEEDENDDYYNKQANKGLNESSLMRASYAAGQAMWPTEDDLVFLFSARYNGDAFNNSYLQAEYRAKTHSVFTGMVDDIIERKLKAFASNPNMYNRYAKRLAVTEMQSNTVLRKAKLFGINITELDVGSLVYDVEQSLQRMINDLILDHPELSDEQADYAIQFMDVQLWSPSGQLLWRYVSAEQLAKLYAYDMISTGVPLLHALDDMIRESFINGEMRGKNPAKVYFAHLLSDDVILDCLDTLKSDEFKDMPVSWAINDVIARTQESSDDEWW